MSPGLREKRTQTLLKERDLLAEEMKIAIKNGADSLHDAAKRKIDGVDRELVAIELAENMPYWDAAMAAKRRTASGGPG